MCTLSLHCDLSSVLCFYMTRVGGDRAVAPSERREVSPLCFALCLYWVKCLCPQFKGFSDTLMIFKKTHTQKYWQIYSVLLSREADHDQNAAAKATLSTTKVQNSHSGSFLWLKSTYTVGSCPVLCHWSWKQPDKEMRSFRFRWLFARRDGTLPFLWGRTCIRTVSCVLSEPSLWPETDCVCWRRLCQRWTSCSPHRPPWWPSPPSALGEAPVLRETLKNRALKTWKRAEELGLNRTQHCWAILTLWMSVCCEMIQN